MPRRFFGKYRGKVTSNIDPFQIGRVQVNVPAIFGEDRLAWAMPCTPYAGAGVGFFTLPPVNANVWVEFEGGDPDYPIWSGCFWGINENPAQPTAIPQIKLFKTESTTITINDTPGAGSLTVEINPPAVALPLKAVFNSEGIEINNNNITTVKLKPDQIELKTGEASTVTLNLADIFLKEASIETKLTPTGIELTSLPAQIKLSTASGIEITNAPTSLKVSATGLDAGAAATALKMNPAAIELSNTAASIKLSPVSVNINNGALEVI